MAHFDTAADLGSAVKNLLNNPKPVVIAIVIFLILFFAYQAKASEVEIGPTWASGFSDGAALGYSERFASGRVDVSVWLIGEQSYKGQDIGNNGNVSVSFVAHRPASWMVALPSELSLGATYWVETSRFIGDELGFNLGVKWRFGKWSIGWRHWSNGGITSPNHGQDVAAFGYRFN